MDIEEIAANLVESEQILNSLWESFHPNDQHTLLQFKDLLGLVANQVKQNGVPSASSPLMLTFKRSFEELSGPTFDSLGSGTQSVLQGISAVVNEYVESPEILRQFVEQSASVTNGYVVEVVSERTEAVELLSSIISIVEREIDNPDLDDDAVSFLKQIISPLLHRLHDLISENQGDIEQTTHAKVESQATVNSLRRLAQYGKSATKAASGASGALIKFALTGDALEKIGGFLG